MAYLLLFVTLIWASTVMETYQQTCNNCCSGPPGPAGNPGTPGIPGQHGSPGSIGVKGDKGERSEPRGETGYDAIKGERGERGFPGKTGPVGAKGVQGAPGQTGQRGEVGPRLVPQTSAFFVSKNSSQTGNIGDILLFSTVRSNLGNDFNIETGVFTCRIAGLYTFAFNVAFTDSATVIRLRKDEDKIVSVYKSQQVGIDMVSNSAILQLEEGNRVWLEFENNLGTVFSNVWHYTTFSGILLQEL